MELGHCPAMVTRLQIGHSEVIQQRAIMAGSMTKPGKVTVMAAGSGWACGPVHQSRHSQLPQGQDVN